MPAVVVIRESKDRFWLFPLMLPKIDGRRNNGKKRGNGISSKEKTSVPSSGMYCPCCYEVVGNGDPDRESIYDEEGKEVGRRHSPCRRRLVVARSQNVGLRETPSLS